MAKKPKLPVFLKKKPKTVKVLGLSFCENQSGIMVPEYMNKI